MTFKWIGAILIIIGCGVIGFSLSIAYRHEEQELQQMVAALEYMKRDLQYRLTPLPDLCRQVGAERSGHVGRMFQNLARELESQISPDVHSCLAVAAATCGELPPRVQKAVCMMGESLGRFDLEGQLHGLESVCSFCSSELDALADGRETRLRSYQTLGLCAGAALAILLV